MQAQGPARKWNGDGISKSERHDPDMKTSSKIESFRDLKVWQKSMDLVELAYDVAELLEEKRKYRLADQIYGSSTSMPSDIAEGFGQGSRVAYAKYIRDARTSSFELDTQLEIVRRRKLVDPELLTRAKALLLDVGRGLTALQKSLERRPSRIQGLSP